MSPAAGETGSARRTGKQEYIDALRGLAILMVILIHTGQSVGNLSPWVAAAVEYGQLGVQLFFVASAYTMCMAWQRRSHEPLPMRSFYLRRFFRIAPLYYVAILLYYVVYVVAPGGALGFSPPYTPFNMAANALLVHGFVPSANNTIVPGGWSIGTEMAFYLVFPFLFVLTEKWKAHPARLVAALLVVMVLNVLMQALVSRATPPRLQNNSFMYFSLLNQLPVFLIGIVGFWWNEGRASKPGADRALSATGFLVGTALCVFLWQADYRFSFALVPAAAGLSFLFLLNLFRGFEHHGRLLRRIGQVSYSMYVFHFIFAWIALGYVLKRFPFDAPPDLTLLVSFPLVTACSFVAANLTERLLERRGIAWGNAIIARLQARAAAARAPRTPRSQPQQL
jgi:peptidoglycan/LPS O-acetylase OafA/YrhL